MISISVDIDAYRARRGFEAAAKTLDDSGRAFVYVGMRKKEKWERRRAAKGFMIVRWAEKHFHITILDPPDREAKELSNGLAEVAADAIERAAETGRPESERLRRAVGRGGGGAVRDAYDIAIERIEGRKLGADNALSRKQKKARLVRTGHATGEFGAVPPLMVDTGRLLRSLRTRWNLGPSRRAY